MDVSRQPLRGPEPTPGRRERISPAEYAILGLLAVVPEAAGMHGYDLGRRFHDGPLSEIIRLEPGMLYHYLKKLSKAGFLSTSVEHQTTRPDRQDHTLTEEGQGVFDRWLNAPVHATRDIRLDFLLKLFFVRQIDTVRAHSLVHAQRVVIASLVDSLTRQREVHGDDPENHDIRRIVLDLRVAQTEAVLGWLDSLPEASVPSPSS